MQIASEAVARQLRVNRGAVIQAVAPNSAAAKAGLLPTRRALSGIMAGDVIVKIDSRPVAKPGGEAIHHWHPDIMGKVYQFNPHREGLLCSLCSCFLWHS